MLQRRAGWSRHSGDSVWRGLRIHQVATDGAHHLPNVSLFKENTTTGGTPTAAYHCHPVPPLARARRLSGLVWGSLLREPTGHPTRALSGEARISHHPSHGQPSSPTAGRTAVACHEEQSHRRQEHRAPPHSTAELLLSARDVRDLECFNLPKRDVFLVLFPDL